ncbi:hypothetical protein BDV29DRAFT_173856 [Aspergillus leporis]|uniref:Uncharacterized protein n=1 Tax=Aspergillus leporis TaxID=41062 RepID=A0A5N5X2P9_9EURO|nr:hypothetical protein BDV29DRAFT_173856 [Aspergillus leporis]
MRTQGFRQRPVAKLNEVRLRDFSHGIALLILIFCHIPLMVCTAESLPVRSVSLRWGRTVVESLNR